MSISLPALKSHKKSSYAWVAWLGLIPFFIFGLAFEILPILTTVRSSFTNHGQFTFEFYRQAMEPLFLCHNI
jgi:ABC-type uncharacterized transport system permease subunit